MQAATSLRMKGATILAKLSTPPADCTYPAARLPPLHCSSASNRLVSRTPRFLPNSTAAATSCALAANSTLLISLRLSAVPSPPVRITGSA
nr:hypothetical protein CPGR_00002 [Mycolicibacter nonchromogenicus]